MTNSPPSCVLLLTNFTRHRARQTAISARNNLAVVLKDQGKLDEAKAMYERALAGRERTLGADHPHTLGTVNNLAGLLNQVGDAAAAAALRERFGCE